ncbi:hypothetical protein DFH11DRAFT_1517754 [Phellopilus nigrolimitatus]|nr:hypothetical protein DFH11DRAFT_1517754 [Phellopilus nigrolimitatus]
MIDCNKFFCHVFRFISNVLTGILMMRVLALYHQKKSLAIFLRTLFILDAAFTLGILLYGNINKESSVMELAEGVTTCVIKRNPHDVWGALSWATPMVYGLILMILALYKAAEYWKESGGFGQLSLVKVLLQDQVIYYFMVILCSAIDLILASESNVANVLLAGTLALLGSPSLLCVIGSHLLVHLKEAGEQGVNEGTSYRMTPVSSIGFS